jgi:cyclopropane fatty-acyl-phospholipid synthase-like methyltransferase
MDELPESDRWNRNLHYHPLLLDLAPARRALDVGCGGGMLTRQLAAVCASVVGVDVDEASVQRARADTASPVVEYRHDDVLTADLGHSEFDLVVSVAALHHMDTSEALARLGDLLEPGGRMGIIGIGRPRPVAELPWNIASIAATQWQLRVKRKRFWHHHAPMVWPPPHTNADVGRIASSVLPGSALRRLVMGRYLLTWTKPGT